MVNRRLRQPPFPSIRMERRFRLRRLASSIPSYDATSPLLRRSPLPLQLPAPFSHDRPTRSEKKKLESNRRRRRRIEKRYSRERKSGRDGDEKRARLRIGRLISVCLLYVGSAVRILKGELLFPSSVSISRVRLIRSMGRIATLLARVSFCLI